ncbi:MAG: hypothetical protein H7257_14730, partial [Taibaiella sp.]|nr:hypothetical protein [Taibaiella sp.]
YHTFIDCVGQPHLTHDEFPFKSLVTKKIVTPATLKFRSATEAQQQLQEGNKDIERDSTGEYHLKVPGIAINDCFQAIDQYGAYSSRIYIMAVPYIGGFNPDYSGLDFCEKASGIISKSIIHQLSSIV